MLLGLSQLEKMLWLERWVGDSQLNVKEQYKTTEVENYTFGNSVSYSADIRFNLLKRYDMSFSASRASNVDKDLVLNVNTDSGENSAWSGQGAFNLKLWRFTVRYDNSLNRLKTVQANLLRTCSPTPTACRYIRICRSRKACLSRSQKENRLDKQVHFQYPAQVYNQELEPERRGRQH